jgi:uncharacterized protein (TIGR03435 family)
VRPAQSGKFIPPTFGINIDDESIPAGGRFIADFPLDIFIDFAYKIMPTREQDRAMFAHVPKWVTQESYVIQATAQGSPNKDQMRLMVQSLLADRFKLVAHFETRTMPALALVTVKAGKTGARLRPHAEGLACDAKWVAPPDLSSPVVPPGGFLRDCSTAAINGPDHTLVLGSRNISIEHLATYLGQMGNFGRPVVDQTGLVGRYDFSLNWMPENQHPSPPGATTPAESQAPTLLEALTEQLGLKLKPVNTQVQVLIIDHVERPSSN